MTTQRPATPTTIYAAIGLIAVAFAAPFIGSFIQDHAPGGDQMILGSFFAWSFMGIGAGFIGVACTIVGAWRSPRSWITITAIVFSALFFVAVVWLISQLQP